MPKERHEFRAWRFAPVVCVSMLQRQMEASFLRLLWREQEQEQEAEEDRRTEDKR